MFPFLLAVVIVLGMIGCILFSTIEDDDMEDY